MVSAVDDGVSQPRIIKGRYNMVCVSGNEFKTTRSNILEIIQSYRPTTRSPLSSTMWKFTPPPTPTIVLSNDIPIIGGGGLKQEVEHHRHKLLAGRNLFHCSFHLMAINCVKVVVIGAPAAAFATFPLVLLLLLCPQFLQLLVLVYCKTLVVTGTLEKCTRR